MTDAGARARPSAAWSDLLRDGRGLHTGLVIGGVLMQALQVQVIAIIMPTVVADIGGGAYYTWAAMIYTVGSILATASLGPVWGRFGPRGGYALGAAVFLAGTVACATASGMAALIAARAVQGYGGGLILGGAMALIGTSFEDRLRARILALYQATWTVSQLFGPVVGGLLAEIGWWRGSFWVMTPFIVGFAAFAWIRLPARSAQPRMSAAPGGVPLLRLGVLAAGVVGVAAAGPVHGLAPRLILGAGGAALLWLAFRLDRATPNRLFPARVFAFAAPIGMAMWVTLLGGIVQTAFIMFLPLLLQVVHGVSPVFISFVNMTISFGWTLGTFVVSGWTGRGERTALLIGPPLILVGVVGLTVTAQLPMLAVLTLAGLVLGLGMGTHNVHLQARSIANAEIGEERISAAAVPTIRSLGTACGAAIAGVLASVAGLGDALEAETVGNAVTFVYACQVLPTLIMMLLMLRLVRMGAARP